MINIVLYEPEIPPNTGNIIRLCANTGVELHLIHPLGFNPTDKQLKRAGLDYHEWARVHHHENFEKFQVHYPEARLLAFSTHGTVTYSQIRYKKDDFLVFGPETRGLPKSLLATFPAEALLRIPMLPHSRSLNLSNSVAIAVYEALRQNEFKSLI